MILATATATGVCGRWECEVRGEGKWDDGEAKMDGWGVGMYGEVIAAQMTCQDVATGHGLGLQAWRGGLTGKIWTDISIWWDGKCSGGGAKGWQAGSGGAGSESELGGRLMTDREECHPTFNIFPV